MYERSKAWEESTAAESKRNSSAPPSRSATPPVTSLPARISSLSLRNTVQPASMSMSNQPPPEAPPTQFSTVVEKQIVGGKFRKKFGVGRKAREVDVLVTTATPAPAPEEMHDWTVVDEGNVYESGGSTAGDGHLPFPGEEESYRDPGIEYSGSSYVPSSPSPHQP